jgi:hypothetical protein
MDQVDALLHCSTLAAQLPQKHLGTVLRPNGGQIYGFRVAVPTLGGSQSGRFISLPPATMANDAVSNQIWLARRPTPVLAYWSLPLLRKATLYRELLAGL